MDRKISLNAFFFHIAFGQGYAMLAKNLTYKITSSLKNNFPTTFPGTNPILIQLELDPNVASRYVSVTIAKQVF